MTCKPHSELDGKHAFLSPSKYTFLNWDVSTLKDRLISSYAQEIGTLTHALAADLINKKQKLTENDTIILKYEMLKNNIPISMVDVSFIFPTLMMYVNDCIDEGMETEQKVVYSNYAFGTVDAITYHPDSKLLKISDLKTGITPAHMEQLMIYAALYCLEFKLKPKTLSFDLKLYQNGGIVYYNPSGDEIKQIADILVNFNYYITQMVTMEV